MEAPVVKKLEYQDSASAISLWYKAIFLAPIWGLAAIPIIGAFALVFVQKGMVDFYASPGWQICLASTMLASALYFVDDLRKRVIVVTNEEIKFGLRKFKLDKLISLGVEYKSEQLMPKRIVLRFRDGKMLKLKVSRLRNDDFESLLRFIETRLPQVHIDPVMLTLMRCKRAAGKAISDAGDSVEIRYQSRFVLNEFKDVFTKTWDDWARIGPILLCVFSIPVWSTVIAQLFMLPAIVNEINKPVYDIDLVKMLLGISESFYRGLGSLGRQENMECVSKLAGHPLTVAMLVCLAGLLAYQLLRLLTQANRIIVQPDKISLLLRGYVRSACLKEIPVNQIGKISLFKKNEMADPSTWFMRFSLPNHKHVDISLAALSPEEKSRMTKAIQRLAPQIPIDAELLETLITRQERSYTELWLQSLSAAPERQSLDPLQPGQMLAQARYEIIRRLGVGGQGTAYLSKDTGLLESHLSELVVLKESIFPVFTESDIRLQALERFEKEASLLRRLEHPGIVSLRDYFLEDHRGYLVLEHVDGKTLKQIVEEEGVLSEMKVRDLAKQMADILCYLHENGVVHRDFTPDNLILNKSGKLKLIDFNVAQQMESGSAGTIVGKQSYLPPEQFRGKANHQSDLYALGATLYFLLIGEDPEPITQSSVLKSGANCSESLDQIVKDCTALQLSKRLQSAAQLSDRLKGLGTQASSLLLSPGGSLDPLGELQDAESQDPKSLVAQASSRLLKPKGSLDPSNESQDDKSQDPNNGSQDPSNESAVSLKLEQEEKLPVEKS